jgi:N-acetylneuraminate synthase
MEIAGRRIGHGQPAYLVAELSANHGQNLEQAIRLVRAAADSGADAVKLQTYTPDTITIRSENPYFRIGSGTVWDGRTLYDLYAEAYTPWEWHERLQGEAHERGIELFSSPFDDSAVDFLEGLNMPAYKIASFEIVDVGLIARVARSGKPVIMSTGMATLPEISEAVAAARASGAKDLMLLKCTSAYPAPPEEANLRTMRNMEETFGLPVGLSDHTLGIAVPVAAAAMGAVLIEKHFTLSRADPGPDSGFSLEPEEFAEMVREVRAAERAVGEISYDPTEKEVASRILRRSLFVVADVRAGEELTPENVRSIRPGHGLHTRYLADVLGRTATRDVTSGTPLSWDLIGPTAKGTAGADGDGIAPRG